jgi:PPM family protein phosphatase
MSIFTTWAARSHTGLVRSANEDSAYAGRWLYAVADGMGGHPAGDVASTTAITALTPYDAPVRVEHLVETAGRAVGAAGAAIRRCAEADAMLRAMGTTLTAMLWSGQAFALAHIGDSRAYRLRSGRLSQLTEDHALHNLVSSTASSPLLAPVLSRYLDARPDRSPDLALRQGQPGDRYLLCSDGLTAVVPDATLHEVLDSGSSPSPVAERLLGMALSLGGPDNVTVIVIDVTSQPQGIATRSQLLGAATVSHETAGA